MTRIAVYAGSFDPVTIGHEDIIRRAARICDQLHVAVMHNVAKRGEFSVEERIALLQKAVGDLPDITISRWDGLMVDYVRHVNANFVIRGIRNSRDFESEKDLAELNSRLLPGLETVFLMTKPEYGCISSSAVREAAAFQADYSSFVPFAVLDDIKAHYNKR